MDKNIHTGQIWNDNKQKTNHKPARHEHRSDGQVISNYQFIKFQFFSSYCLFCALKFVAKASLGEFMPHASIRGLNFDDWYLNILA